MTNTICIFIYTPLLVMNILFLVSGLLQRAKQPAYNLYCVLCALLIGWLVFEMSFFAFSNETVIEFVYSAKFIFAAFIPPVFFLLVTSFFRMGEKTTRKLRLALFILPSITAVVSSTAIFHELFRVNFEIISLHPLTVVSSSWGVFYILNLATSQIFVAAMLIIFITQYRTLPKAYLVSIKLLIIACATYITGIVIEIFQLAPKTYLDFNLIGLCISSFLFYIAVYSNGRADYLNIWRRDMFDYLDEAILILNKNEVIVEANSAAQKLFAEFNSDIEMENYSQLIQEARQANFLSVRTSPQSGNEDNGYDLVFTNGNFPLIYSIERQELPISPKAVGGEFIALTEVTWNRLLIERLSETAGVDPLTGLNNRFDYEGNLNRMDCAENLPLSVIMADVNNLKLTNDTLGHAAGDNLLKNFSSVLTEYSPVGSYIARIGGDEFVILLPNSGEKEAEEVIETLQHEMHNVQNDETSLSAAFGYATKNNIDENIKVLMRQADELMYDDKKLQRRSV